MPTDASLDELKSRIAQLEQDLAFLRITREQRAAPAVPARTPITSRCDMLKALGVTAGAGAAALVVKPGSAAANNGDTLIAAQITTETGTTGHPTSGNHNMGELYVDSAGVLFFCVAAGTPGTWKQVSFV